MALAIGLAISPGPEPPEFDLDVVSAATASDRGVTSNPVTFGVS